MILQGTFYFTLSNLEPKNIAIKNKTKAKPFPKSWSDVCALQKKKKINDVETKRNPIFKAMECMYLSYYKIMSGIFLPLYSNIFNSFEKLVSNFT